MNYQETIDFLFGRLPMFSRIGAAAYKADLSNTIRICDSLGNPQHKFKAVHIAGTNGKGSVSHMLAAIFQTAGYKTGLYTSPHLKDFRERIKVNGEMISEEFVIDFTKKTIPLINQIEPSFFEITVAMAFDYFAKENVDIAIIETGLGGRLDSTNIITPELSVITNIGMDHMQFLGNTLEKIAYEKAGIIKPGVPVVVGETVTETKPVFENIAAEKKSEIFFAPDRFHATTTDWEEKNLSISVSDSEKNEITTYKLDLSGIYQQKNLLTVLESTRQLLSLGWKIEPEHLQQALQNVKKLTGLFGRWEILHTNPLLVLDVAHNTEGIKQVLEQIKVTQHDKLHIILGMVKDKDIDEVLKLLPKNATYYFTKAEIPRSLPEEELATKAEQYNLKGKPFMNANAALYSASHKATKKDMIIVCGSVFLVGEVSLKSVKEIWKKDGFASFSWDFMEMLSFAD